MRRRTALLTLASVPPLLAAGCEDEAVVLPTVTVVVDFASTAFPPSVRKLGVNAQWNESNPTDFTAIDVASAIGAPMVAGLVETKYGPSDVPGPTSTLGPDPLFFRDGGNVETRTDADLTALRAAVRDGGMINLLQLAGTPTTDGVFAVDGKLEAPSNGNFYPMPEDATELAEAFAAFAKTLASSDHAPTLFCFWQEPDHTLGANLTREQSLARYLDFYAAVGPALRAVDRDFMVAGVQQNASAGLSGGGKIDGADYGTWTGMLLGREATDGVRYPLDYVTLQNYKGDRTLEIVQNTRVAYADERFQLAPILFNEWDLDKGADFDTSYDSPARLVAFAARMGAIYDQPDVAYALLMRNLFAQSPLAFPIVEWLCGMSPFRRVLALGDAAEGLAGIASGDDASLAILVWNDGEGDRPVTFDLQRMSPALVASGGAITIETLSRGAPESTRTVPLTSTELALDPVVVPRGGVVMVRVGSDVPQSAIRQARYARDRRWVGRRADGSPPRGMGHFDVRDGSLVVAVDGEGGVGVCGVVLADLPAVGAVLGAAIGTSGELTSPSAFLALRVDYLEGNATTKTVWIRDSVVGAIAMPPMLPGWPPAGPAETTSAELVAGRVTFPVGAEAPASWSTADAGARRIEVSLWLAGAEGPATVRARLDDGA